MNTKRQKSTDLNDSDEISILADNENGHPDGHPFFTVSASRFRIASDSLYIM